MVLNKIQLDSDMALILTLIWTNGPDLDLNILIMLRTNSPDLYLNRLTLIRTNGPDLDANG